MTKTICNNWPLVLSLGCPPNVHLQWDTDCCEVRIKFQSLNVSSKARERSYEVNKENTPSASEIVTNIAICGMNSSWHFTSYSWTTRKTSIDYLVNFNNHVR